MSNIWTFSAAEQPEYHHALMSPGHGQMRHVGRCLCRLETLDLLLHNSFIPMPRPNSSS